MKEQIDKIDKIIGDNNKKNIDKVIEDHLIKIQFYQHERLVHFLVTMLFAIMFLITFLYSLENPSLGIIMLVIMFFALLVPYILHYYNLENSVKYMYKQYDKLKEIENNK
jgi:hypothetical protein